MKNDGSIELSVIIPTFNRVHLLPKTIESFLNQTLSPDKYEIIISNNNSSDNTQEIIDGYVGKCKNLRTLFVKEQGVHYARNQAALVAKGRFLYFTDDDMIADAKLLEKILVPFGWSPKIGVVTGLILPLYEREPDPWVHSTMHNYLLSLTPREFDFESLVSRKDFGIFSCHQALRREVFFEAGGFNPENTAGSWIGDGETGLNIKIMKSNKALFAFTRQSVVHHMIPPSRCNFRYLIKRLKNEGQCNACTVFRAGEDGGLAKDTQRLMLALVGGVLRMLAGKRNWRLVAAQVIQIIYLNHYFFKIRRDKKLRELLLIDDWLDDRTQ